MMRADPPSRLRRVLAGLIVCVLALVVFAVAIALVLICLVGIALLVTGLASWLHPVDVASAWARTLGGVGLTGGSAGLAALGWLAVERLAGPLGRLARLRNRTRHPSPVATGERAGMESESALQRTRKFVAVVGILLALICLPFAAAIHASAHAPWFGWVDSSSRSA